MKKYLFVINFLIFGLNLLSQNKMEFLSTKLLSSKKDCTELENTLKNISDTKISIDLDLDVIKLEFVEDGKNQIIVIKIADDKNDGKFTSYNAFLLDNEKFGMATLLLKNDSNGKLPSFVLYANDVNKLDNIYFYDLNKISK